MPPPRYILALDQGTTGIDGARRGRRGRRPRSRLRRAHAALSAARAGSSTTPRRSGATVVRGGASRAGRGARDAAAEIAAVGITNQRETTLVWERATGQPDPSRHRLAVPPHGRDVRRAEGRRARRRSCASAPGWCSTRTSPAPRSRWLLDHVPRARAPGRARASSPSAPSTAGCVWKLTGGRVHVTDATNASRTLCFDLRTVAWDDEMLARLTIPREVLPTVRRLVRADRARRTTSAGCRPASRSPGSPATSRRRSSGRRAIEAGRPRTPTAPAASSCSTPATRRWPPATGC